jgi:hypothetical protein
LRPESLPGRATATAATARRGARPADAPCDTPLAGTRAAALALAFAFAAVVLLPAGSVYLVKVLRVPQAAVLGFAVPAAALALLAALGLAHWSRGAAAAGRRS